MRSLPLLFGLLASAFGIDESSPVEPAKHQAIALRNYYAMTAARYEFFRDPDKQQKLNLIPTPILKWTMDNDWSGDVFIWERSQRPEIIGCILASPEEKGSRKVYQEFHLLGEKPNGTTELIGQVKWTPKEGLALKPAAGAPKPAETAPLRLSQMRQIMRDFTAKMQAEGEWELRLLPQPLHRYQPTEGDAIDGALFAFVWTKGTDPELILRLECRKTSEGLGWFYSPAQFTTREVWLLYQDQEVWRVPGLNGRNEKETFITVELGDYKTAKPQPRQDSPEATKPK